MKEKKMITLLLSLCATIIFFVGCDVKKAKFSDFKAVKDSGYLENGWILSDFLQNTFDIKERHNLDTNQVWIKSQFSGELNLPHTPL